MSGRREKGKLFCLGAPPAASAPHFTLFRATVWRQREKVSTSGTGRARGPRCHRERRPRAARRHRGARVHRPRPSAVMPRRLLRRRVHGRGCGPAAAGARGPSARPGATPASGAARGPLGPEPISRMPCGSDARERRAGHPSARQGASRASARTRGATPASGAVRGRGGASRHHARAALGRHGADLRASARPRDARGDPRGRGCPAQSARARRRSESSSGAACARFCAPCMGAKAASRARGPQGPREPSPLQIPRRASDAKPVAGASEGLAPCARKAAPASSRHLVSGGRRQAGRVTARRLSDGWRQGI